jgi:hypothetical protein
MGVLGGVRSNLALGFLVACCNAFAGETVLVGPVERVSSTGTELLVLGQLVKMGPSTQVLGDQGAAVEIGRDQHVAVSAALQTDGSYVASELRALSARHVHGASEVFIRGVVRALDVSTATFKINGLTVYFGDLVYAPNLRLRIGEQVSVAGKQPNPSGSVWASRVETIDLLGTTQEPFRSNTDNSSGSEKQIAVGKDRSMQSITGTGVHQQSITGTGVLQQSITGTGIRQQSITGTGVRQQSITGTGIRQQSITGTGVRQQSITGTGIRQQSITGTGVRQQSITGTGVRQQSITGTGVRQQSITGTGVRQQGITRAGATLQSITGTGRQRQILSGSAAHY